MKTGPLSKSPPAFSFSSPAPYPSSYSAPPVTEQSAKELHKVSITFQSLYRL
ncbi:hypothetical protein HanOQP8_Chr16g0630401 [Helianthus annuus]|nr:hypothetical protein HanHA89_Chr16g0675591 [Helianthus annuus]KAJ0646010.1 hypothetical protein HanOQP8_Chr16g0630401 [Helianthus annuus]